MPPSEEPPRHPSRLLHTPGLHAKTLPGVCVCLPWEFSNRSFQFCSCFCPSACWQAALNIDAESSPPSVVEVAFHSSDSSFEVQACATMFCQIRASLLVVEVAVSIFVEKAENRPTAAAVGLQEQAPRNMKTRDYKHHCLTPTASRKLQTQSQVPGGFKARESGLKCRTPLFARGP